MELATPLRVAGPPQLRVGGGFRVVQPPPMAKLKIKKIKNHLALVVGRTTPKGHRGGFGYSRSANLGWLGCSKQPPSPIGVF
jgi:hypothetical protein